jgi:hypothetical protein
MSLCQLSTTTWEDIGSPTDYSPTSVQTWMVYNIGRLNAATYNCYTAVGATGVVPELGNQESAILGEIFKSNYYGRKIMSTLTAGSLATSWTSLTDGDSSIKRMSPSEAAKVFKDLKNSSDAQLRLLINDYRNGKSNPLSVDYYTIDNNNTAYTYPDTYYPGR